MSEEQNISGSGGADQSQPETPSAPSGSKSVDPEPSASRLTVENVKKLEREYPAAKSSLARLSVAAYLQGCESEAGLEVRREPNPPSGTESEATSGGPPGEDAAENDPEPLGKIPDPDVQRRFLTPPVPETKYRGEISEGKREFADLETQTEWSYPSTPWSSAEKAKRKRGKEAAKEDSESAESNEGIIEILAEERRARSVIRSAANTLEQAEEEAALEALFTAEEHPITKYCVLGCCEFCSTALKRFPSPKELEERPERMESVFCCRTYKEIFRCVIQELVDTRIVEGEIDITPHRRLSQTLLESKTRSFLLEELLEYGIENYKELFEQYMKFGPCVKLGYKLSDHAPRRPTVVVKKRLRPKDILKIDPEFRPEQEKMCHPFKPVKKYYPDGKILLLLLPDGTGQLLICYPSGNIAILITSVKGVQFTYLVLADGPHRHLLAFFSNQGYAACYYPNGKVRVQLDLCHGSSFDERGIPQKLWSWWDATRHVHAPPFQPIYIQFNIYMLLKMKAQDQIFLTFSKLHNCIRLNVGARLKLKDPSMLPLLQSLKSKPSVSEAKAQQIKTLLAKVQEEMREVSAAPPAPTMSLDLTIRIVTRLKNWRHKMTFEQEKQSGLGSSSLTSQAPKVLTFDLGTAPAPAQPRRN